jgi:hypothetical protein
MFYGRGPSSNSQLQAFTFLRVSMSLAPANGDSPESCRRRRYIFFSSVKAGKKLDRFLGSIIFASKAGAYSSEAPYAK